MQALVDLVKVLFEPAAVFERVREKPRFLVPFLGLAVVQIIVGVINLPYLQAGMRAQMAGRTMPAGAPDPSSFAFIGVIAVPVVLVIIFLISTLILWVLVSVFGGEGKFGTLLSVVTYASVPSVILLSIIGAIVLRMKGVDTMTSPADLQPALGLDLVMPGVKGFLGGMLKAINPFSIWSLVLTAIGVKVTHRLSQGSAYGAATVHYLFAVLLAGVGGLFNR
jgi:hypothetical protein